MFIHVIYYSYLKRSAGFPFDALSVCEVIADNPIIKTISTPPKSDPKPILT
jgi:hypothetical protein